MKQGPEKQITLSKEAEEVRSHVCIEELQAAGADKGLENRADQRRRGPRETVHRILCKHPVNAPHGMSPFLYGGQACGLCDQESNGGCIMAGVGPKRNGLPLLSLAVEVTPATLSFLLDSSLLCHWASAPVCPACLRPAIACPSL